MTRTLQSFKMMLPQKGVSLYPIWLRLYYVALTRATRKESSYKIYRENAAHLIPELSDAGEKKTMSSKKKEVEPQSQGQDRL